MSRLVDAHGNTEITAQLPSHMEVGMWCCTLKLDLAYNEMSAPPQ